MNTWDIGTTVLPLTTTKDDPLKRMFKHPHELRGDGPDMFFCGHYDGHDVYRRIDVDLWVLVYGDAKEAVFEMYESKVHSWHTQVKYPYSDETHWGSFRAVLKAMHSTSHRLDELIDHLREVVQNLPDEGHNGWCRRAVDVCHDAADWIEELRKGVGI